MKVLGSAAVQTAYEVHRAGNLAEAARLYGEILRTEPGNAEVLYLLGFVHFQRGEFSDAERLMDEALKCNPQAFDALYNRAYALAKLTRYEEAIALFDRLIDANPAIVEAWAARGKALLDLGRNEQAIESVDRALALNPKLAAAWNNRGVALHRCGRTEEALESYERALAIKSDPAVLNNCANILGELKRYQEQAATYERLLEADPIFPYARGSLAYCRLQICDWQGLEESRLQIAEGVRSGARVAQPGSMLATSDSPTDQLRCARIWAENEIPAREAIWTGERYVHDRLRIAYVSADFCAHAVANLLAGVLEEHDKKRFEITAISFGPDDGSAIRRRLSEACEHFIDVRGESDTAIARLLRNKEIDIAVDLMGYTAGCRPGILAQRPAPMQVSFLGYPGTTGAVHIDYLIADRTVIPEPSRSYYSEAAVTLPDAYLPSHSLAPGVRTPPSRAQAGLPEDGFVFAAFSACHKISPEMFSIWMRLLSAVEGSVLWLLEDNTLAVANLRREAELKGVDQRRLVFAPRRPRDEHFARQCLGDLFLDTLPYGAHATALDALSAAVPVVTCLGSAFAGRVAASLLHAAGVPELIARSTHEYESLALMLARDPALLASLKERLANNRMIAPLFDTRRFTRHLEKAYAAMQARHERGERPSHFAVEPIS